LSESEPIILSARVQGGRSAPSPRAAPGRNTSTLIAFDRQELSEILGIYGRKVAAGEWRDYAIDLGPEKAVFSVYRRASECPLYRIEKCPKLARRQGAYSVVAATGSILKRGGDLGRVLDVLERRVRLVD
jgi:hypothetical protein